MNEKLIESVRALAEAQKAHRAQPHHDRPAFAFLKLANDFSFPALLAALERAEKIEAAAQKLAQHLEFTYGPISPSLSPTKILVCELNAALSEPQ